MPDDLLPATLDRPAFDAGLNGLPLSGDMDPESYAHGKLVGDNNQEILNTGYPLGMEATRARVGKDLLPQDISAIAKAYQSVPEGSRIQLVKPYLPPAKREAYHPPFDLDTIEKGGASALNDIWNLPAPGSNSERDRLMGLPEHRLGETFLQFGNLMIPGMAEGTIADLSAGQLLQPEKEPGQKFQQGEGMPTLADALINRGLPVEAAAVVGQVPYFLNPKGVGRRLSENVAPSVERGAAKAAEVITDLGRGAGPTLEAVRAGAMRPDAGAIQWRKGKLVGLPDDVKAGLESKLDFLRSEREGEKGSPGKIAFEAIRDSKLNRAGVEALLGKNFEESYPLLKAGRNVTAEGRAALDTLAHEVLGPDVSDEQLVDMAHDWAARDKARNSETIGNFLGKAIADRQKDIAAGEGDVAQHKLDIQAMQNYGAKHAPEYDWSVKEPVAPPVAPPVRQETRLRAAAASELKPATPTPARPPIAPVSEADLEAGAHQPPVEPELAAPVESSFPIPEEKPSVPGGEDVPQPPPDLDFPWSKKRADLIKNPVRDALAELHVRASGPQGAVPLLTRLAAMAKNIHGAEQDALVRTAMNSFRNEQAKAFGDIKPGSAESRQVAMAVRDRASIPSLPPKIQKAAAWMAQKYDELHATENQVRQMYGEEPIQSIENYGHEFAGKIETKKDMAVAFGAPPEAGKSVVKAPPSQKASLPSTTEEIWSDEPGLNEGNVSGKERRIGGMEPPKNIPGTDLPLRPQPESAGPPQDPAIIAKGLARLSLTRISGWAESLFSKMLEGHQGYEHGVHGMWGHFQDVMSRATETIDRKKLAFALLQRNNPEALAMHPAAIQAVVKELTPAMNQLVDISGVQFNAGHIGNILRSSEIDGAKAFERWSREAFKTYYKHPVVNDAYRMAWANGEDGRPVLSPEGRAMLSASMSQYLHLQSAVGKLYDTNLAKFTGSYLMRRLIGDSGGEWVNNAFGARSLTKVSDFINRLQYNAQIGLKPILALHVLSQNDATITSAGFENFVKALGNLNSEEGAAILKKLDFPDTTRHLGNEVSLGVSGGPISRGVNAAEKVAVAGVNLPHKLNKNISGLAEWYKAKSEGLSDADALVRARARTAQSQGMGIAGNQTGLTHPLISPFRPFTNYLATITTFLASIADEGLKGGPKEWATAGRKLATYAALSYLVYDTTIGSGMGDQPFDPKHPFDSFSWKRLFTSMGLPWTQGDHGAPSLPGLNATGGLPDVAKDAYGAVKGMFPGQQQKNFLYGSDSYLRTLEKFNPLFGTRLRILMTGQEVDHNGKVVVTYPPEERIFRALGASPYSGSLLERSLLPEASANIRNEQELRTGGKDALQTAVDANRQAREGSPGAAVKTLQAAGANVDKAKVKSLIIQSIMSSAPRVYHMLLSSDDKTFTDMIRKHPEMLTDLMASAKAARKAGDKKAMTGQVLMLALLMMRQQRLAKKNAISPSK